MSVRSSAFAVSTAGGGLLLAVESYLSFGLGFAIVAFAAHAGAALGSRTMTRPKGIGPVSLVCVDAAMVLVLALDGCSASALVAASALSVAAARWAVDLRFAVADDKDTPSRAAANRRSRSNGFAALREVLVPAAVSAALGISAAAVSGRLTVPAVALLIVAVTVFVGLKRSFATRAHPIIGADSPPKIGRS